MRRDHDLSVGLRRARRTAGTARAVLAIAWIATAAAGLTDRRDRDLAIAAFGVILFTAVVQLTLPSRRWLVIEEAVAPIAAVLIIGLGPEAVLPQMLVWLVCVACGVIARGGRQHWSGRTVLLVSLALPIVLHWQLSWAYSLFVLATIVLLLTCGRITNELRAMLERAQFEIDHDGLTDLLSRRSFRAELDHVAADAVARPEHAREPLVLLLLDLHGFGAVNKLSGHAAGDALLCAVAERLTAIVGRDGCVGRVGGDEFALILRGGDAETIAYSVLGGLSEDPGVKARAGMARIPADGEDAESLLSAVDIALRVARRSGRDEVSVYAGGSLADGGAREALTRIIAGEGLSIAVQPIVSVPDGAIHAHEALARFPSAGPLHWFALAEELGMRDQLELACLRAALALAPERPAGSVLSINLSGPQLLDPRVRAELDALDSLDGIILELTENSLIEDSDTIHDEITRLIDRGVRFAVDDLGAGYSGLRQIATLRPSYLKLDRALVNGIDGDPIRAALVVAMVGWSTQTGGLLVAEGVETVAELDALVALGVPLVQGYLLARPGPPWPQVSMPGPATTPASPPASAPAPAFAPAPAHPLATA